MTVSDLWLYFLSSADMGNANNNRSIVKRTLVILSSAPPTHGKIVPGPGPKSVLYLASPGLILF